MLDNLKEIYNMLESINQSTSDKRILMKQYLRDPVFGKTFRQVLIFITDQKHKFNIKQIKFCAFFEDKFAEEHQNVKGIFQMLDYLGEKGKSSSSEEIAFLERISSSNPETVEVVTRILNKFSGCGLTNEQIVEILNEKEEEETSV